MPFYKKSDNENGFEYANESIKSPSFTLGKSKDKESCRVMDAKNNGWQWFDTESEMRAAFKLKPKEEIKEL